MMKFMDKTKQYELDKISISRRALLKYALTAAVANSLIGKTMAETTLAPKPNHDLSIENF